MKLDVLFALPGPQNPVKGDKLLVVAAATEHEDPHYLSGVISDVAQTAMDAGAYRAVQKVTLELDESVVLALLQAEAEVVRPSAATSFPQARLDRARLH